VTEFQVGDINANFQNTESIEDFDAVVVILFSSEKLVLVRNQDRGWEFPGGHREGGETFEETAVREVYEEARAKITDIQYLGYYVSSTGHTTIVLTAELDNLLQPGKMDFEIRLFDRLPPALSFGDGREQLFVDQATKNRGKPGL
jgi:8-oxo-dGTP pyrophosphatase MutT (NUDIX family)